MVKESAPNPAIMENKISTSNNSNESEHTKTQFCENLKTIAEPKDAERKNYLTPITFDHGLSVSTLTEAPSNIDQSQSNQSPSEIDINGIAFQLNHSGQPICIPESMARRELINCNLIDNNNEQYEDEDNEKMDMIRMEI